MSSRAHYPLGILLAVSWSLWLAFICFRRAIYPPKDNSSFGYMEVERVNRHPLVRALMVLSGLLMLAIGIGLAVTK